MDWKNKSKSRELKRVERRIVKQRPLEAFIGGEP